MSYLVIVIVLTPKRISHQGMVFQKDTNGDFRVAVFTGAERPECGIAVLRITPGNGELRAVSRSSPELPEIDR